MLGQSKTTSLFFSVQRLKAGTLSFPLHPYTFAVQKERLSDGMKGTEKGSRMTEERRKKGWIKKNNETNKGIQPETIKVYGSLKYLRVLHQRVGNAAVPGTHIIQCVYQVGDKGC